MKKSNIKNQKSLAKKAEKEEGNGSDSEKESVKEENEGEVKHEVKIENTEVLITPMQGPKKWFEDNDDDEKDDGDKWDYLEHHGVTFPDPFIPRGLTVHYDGKEIK